MHWESFDCGDASSKSGPGDIPASSGTAAHVRHRS